MSELLKLENISTGYDGKPIIENISLLVNKGEVLTIIGQNGCGKSTLLKTIARIITDNSGMITFDNTSLDKKKFFELKKMGISYLLQDGLVFPTLKVSEHFDLALLDKTADETKKLKSVCFKYFPKIKDFLHLRGGNLSGGQKQMLSFAMLLCQDTKLWLLDEPTAGLSPKIVEDLILFLNKIKQNQEKTIILVEHNYKMAFRLSDSVAVISNGTINKVYKNKEFLKDNFLDKNIYNN